MNRIRSRDLVFITASTKNHIKFPEFQTCATTTPTKRQGQSRQTLKYFSSNLFQMTQISKSTQIVLPPAGTNAQLCSANKLDSLSSKETTVPVLRNELLTPGSTIIMRSIYHCRLADTAGQQPIHPAGPGRTRVLVYNYDQNDRHHKYSLLATYAHHDNQTIDKYRAMVTDLSLSFLKTLSCFICKYKKKECLHVCIWFRVHLAWDLKNHDKAPASS